MSAAEVIAETRGALRVVEGAGDFKLGSLIREVLEESDLTDPRDIAALVAARIPEDVLPGLLVEFVIHPVQHVIRGQRGALRRGRVSTAASPRWSQAESVLALRVSVGVAGWKFLGDCTPRDLADVIATHKQHAKSNLEQAKRYVTLRERVVAAHAANVAALGAPKVEAILRG